MAICMGDRNKILTEGENILTNYRKMIKEYMNIFTSQVIPLFRQYQTPANDTDVITIICSRILMNALGYDWLITLGSIPNSHSSLFFEFFEISKIIKIRNFQFFQILKFQGFQNFQKGRRRSMTFNA